MSEKRIAVIWAVSDEVWGYSLDDIAEWIDDQKSFATLGDHAWSYGAT